MIFDHDVVIRAATAEDFPAWFTLFETVAAEARWIASEAPMDRERREETFTGVLSDPDAVTLLAETFGQLVGICGLQIREGVAELGLLIDARWRERGIGSLLMVAAIAWGREHAAHKISLEVWPHNVAAIALYEKFGFVREGYLRRQYRRRDGSLWDAVTMGLVLDEEAAGHPTD
jgi:putative acetyltransferase